MTDEKAELLEILENPVERESLNDAEREELREFIAKGNPDQLEKKGTAETQTEMLKETSEGSDIRILLASMDLPGKVKYALFGNSICRGILIRDSNKMVQQFVMKNPKISLKEIEEFSKNQHLSDFVLRTISDSKTWMKSNTVRFNIVTNPKTPQDVALKWIRYLQTHELKRIAKSKNLPQLIATVAKKLVAD